MNTRIGISSCVDQDASQAGIWEAALATKPDFFIFAGDNVYASEQPWQVENVQRAYAKQQKVVGFMQLRAAVPHLAIWDDHDYGLNDGGVNFPFKEESKAEFLKYWDVPHNDARRHRQGLYTSALFGELGQRVQVIMLDTRYFRSDLKITDKRNAPGKERYVPDDTPSKTMLGEAQWAWLENTLKEAADVRLIVSGIQVIATGHGWERWGNFPYELTRLKQLAQQAGTIAFLSGDRHIGAIYREGDFFELTSSGITHPWAKPTDLLGNRLQLYTEKHFGSVDINWQKKTLSYNLHDERGTIRFSEQQHFK